MKLNKKFATFYGILLGDGCLSRCGKGYFISIVGHKKDDLSFFIKIKPLIKSVRGKQTPFRIREKYGKVEYNFSDKNLFQNFTNLEFPVGKKGTNLKISKSLKQYQKEVIKGIFSTDGSLVITNNNGTIYPRLEISGISRVLLEQIKEYYDSIGIKSHIYISKKYTNTWNALYRLQSNGKKNLFLFKEKIGFLNPKHEEKFRKYEKTAGGGTFRKAEFSGLFLV